MDSKSFLATVIVAVCAIFVGMNLGGGESRTASAAPRDKMKVEVIVEVGPKASVSAVTRAISNIGSSGADGFRIDSFFDITYARNIGSSGMDGFQVDSFFDIFYAREPAADGFDTEIVAMSLKCTLDNPNNPGGVIDAVKAAAESAGANIVHGHVTVLK